MNDPRIRPFESWDIGPVTSLVRTIRAQANLAADYGGTGVDVRGHGEDPGSSRSASWVIEDDGEVVGVITAIPVDDDVCEIRRLYLEPGVQGRGWGRLMVEHAAVWAAGASYRQLAITLPAELGQTSGFLRRLSFQSMADGQYVLTL